MNRLNKKLDGLVKHAGVAFLIALVFYVIAYSFIEHRRNRLGPWEVKFSKNETGAPTLLISQPALAITNVQITFVGTGMETNADTMLVFAQPFPVPYPVPHGRVVFMDTTFLPGTIVFDLFGHEIQLIPRVLTIDKQERPWHSNEKIFLSAPATNAVRQSSRMLVQS